MSAGRRLGATGSGWLAGVAVALALFAGGLPPLAAAEAGPGAGEQPSSALRAQGAVAAAKAEQAASRFQNARDLYQQALTIDPANAEARVGLAQVDGLIAGRGAQDGTVDQALVQGQLAQVEARVQTERAELLAASGRYEEARICLDFAHQQLRPFAQLPAVDSDLKRIDALLADVQERDRRSQGVAARGDRGQARDLAEQNAQVASGRFQGVFKERMARIVAIKEHQHYELALSACRKLVSDYPSEAKAEALFNELLALTHDQRRLDAKERGIELRQEVMERIHNSLIPTGFDGDAIYPGDWAQRRGQRSSLDSPAELPAWHEAILDRLGQRVTFDFEDVALNDALTFVAKQANLNMVVDPTLYTGAERKVTLKATNMRLDNALSWLARLADAKWNITNGAVYVGGMGEEKPITAVYDVSSFSFQPPDFPGHTISFGGGGKGGKGGGGFDLFKTAQTAGKGSAPEDVVDLIQKSVSPETWKKDGNAITIRGTTLFVDAPPDVHKLLQQFIRSQAYARNVLVHIDARWLSINDGYLEEIGVNWGGATSLLVQNNGGVAPGFSQGNAQDAFVGSVLNTLPAPAVAPNPATANSGLNLSALRIGGSQVSAILTAIERKAEARILSSPSIATLNGVEGNCFFGQQFAYIADYEIVNNNLDPQIQVLNVGASLDIKPFVSADRKYVTMEFRPALASIVGIFTEIINAPLGTIVNGGVLNPVPIIVAYPLELPNILLDEVSTTITVPDKGTLLVGGFGKHVEQQMSTKVPFIGHIPFLGRLFGQRGRYSDRSQLYLLATVHIINYEEVEANL